MAKILIHLTSGPEHPTRAPLGFLVGRAAAEEGHDVALFLAGDSVQLLGEPVLDSPVGLGTGSLRESYDALVTAGARFYASGISSVARWVQKATWTGRQRRRCRGGSLARSRARQSADVLKGEADGEADQL